MIAALRRIFGSNTDLMMVVGMLGILVVLFSPIPPRALDFLLLLNVGFALLLLLLTFYVEKPVQFSTYPSLLLIATLFRLSLNIAATRLILSNADAGRVIAAIGSYVVQGNYVIGLIVFLILVVVQYVVVTSGAQRVAEVAARFTLDSMPGQQMSIDADLNMGFIDQAEAQRRRKNIEKEANFYGAMDGASKFVKGDAIAGIVILLINILGGLAVGVAQLGMSWAEAGQTYTLLTIGDGIVTQVPALVISVGTGIIVTRSGTDSHLGQEILEQIVAFPKAMALVVLALLGIGMLPGMPMFPILIIAGLLAGATYFAFKTLKSGEGGKEASDTTAAKGEEEQLADLLVVLPIEIRVGVNLVSLINGDDAGLADRIGAFRKQIALDSGLIVPTIKIRDDAKASANGYQISVYGVASGNGELHPDKFLAMHPSGTRGSLTGIETRDPSYGLPAVWIAEEQKSAARAAGFILVDPLTVFVTHLTETLRRNASTLLTRAAVGAMIDRLREQNSGLVDDLVPAVMSVVEIQKVLQGLLREGVSIRHVEAIFEVLADVGRHAKAADKLIEAVRQRLGPSICQSLSGNKGELSVLTLDPVIEQKIAGSIQSAEETTRLVLEPKFAEAMLGRLAGHVEQMMKGNLSPVLLCAPEQRRHLRAITERVLPHLAVLALTEIPTSLSLKSYAVVKV
jgi:flagellar biosynthesis protein FlhA